MHAAIKGPIPIPAEHNYQFQLKYPELQKSRWDSWAMIGLHHLLLCVLLPLCCGLPSGEHDQSYRVEEELDLATSEFTVCI